MIDKITTAIIALVFAALMTWYVLSPFLAPQLYFRAMEQRPVGNPPTPQRHF